MQNFGKLGRRRRKSCKICTTFLKTTHLRWALRTPPFLGVPPLTGYPPPFLGLFLGTPPYSKFLDLSTPPPFKGQVHFKDKLF